MSLRLSHELFAAQGNAWATPNYQHNAGQTVRQRRWPDGSLRDVEVDWLIEGYGPDGEPKRAPERRCDPRKVAPMPVRFVPRAGERRSLPPAGEHWHDAEELKGKATPLTEEQLRLRKRQRAQVQARLTRARNRLAAREQARQDAINALIVKLSQGE